MDVIDQALIFLSLSSGPTLYGLAHVGAMGPIKIGMVQCFVFASLIVAVDPVAVSFFESMQLRKDYEILD